MSDLINYKNIIQQWNINESWTLFLDRGGVINQRKIGGYITMIDEFEFTPGALQLLLTQIKSLEDYCSYKSTRCRKRNND